MPAVLINKRKIHHRQSGPGHALWTTHTHVCHPVLLVAQADLHALSPTRADANHSSSAEHVCRPKARSPSGEMTASSRWESVHEAAMTAPQRTRVPRSIQRKACSSDARPPSYASVGRPKRDRWPAAASASSRGMGLSPDGTLHKWARCDHSSRSQASIRWRRAAAAASSRLLRRRCASRRWSARSVLRRAGRAQARAASRRAAVPSAAHTGRARSTRSSSRL